MAEALIIVVLQKITSALGEEGLKIIGLKLQKQVPDMQDVINRMRLLQSDLSMMQAFINQVDAHSSSDKLLEAWLEQVRQAAHEAEDIVDEYVYLVGQMEGTHSFLKRALNQAADVKRWRKLAAHAKFVEDCLKKITETKNRFDVSAADNRRDNALSYSSRLQHLSEHSYLNDDDDFVGNKEEVKCLTEWLSDLRKGRTVISICGMGGLGKTTMASSIYKKEETKRMFVCRAWISVSQSYRVKDLLQKILLQLMAKSENIPDGLDTMDCVNLVELLRRYLKDRRYLIVLDDVWSRDSWPLLDSAFVKNDNGSRIIITTRIQDVSSVADSNREMKLSLLPKEEAWTLFCQKAFSRLDDRSCPISLKTCAERIVGKCQGLPLALVALGSLLSYKEMDEHEWELFYRQLRWQLSSNPELSWVASVLNLSYNDLPSYLKNCFLYCGLFPEDYQIKRKQLIRLWIAEGFVEDRGPAVTLADVAACYLKELTDRSLLQVVDRNEYGRPKRFQMHDLVREISLTISKKEKFATTCDYPNPDCNSDGSRRVSIQKDGILMPVKISAQLRSIIVFVEEVSLSWFRDCYPSFRLLRVLSLRHCHIQKIPDNVSNLFNLHYLDLGYTLLKEIPRSIAKLSNLQTLYLKGSVLELPSEVTMLTKLQHLIIDVGRFGSSASNKICRQEHLQTLKYIEANSCVVRNLGCLTRMRSLGIRKVLDSYNTDLWTSVSNMKTLASLSVITADRDRDILDLSDLKPLPYLEKLMLSGRLDKGAIPPPFGHFPKLKSLRLCFSGLHEDPLALLAVMFQNLGHLNLYRCYDGTRLTFRARWFPMLKHLYLSSMGELKVVEIEDGTLRTLRRLELWGLKSLTSVPEGLVHLKSLQQLCIGTMMPEEFKTRLEGRDRWIVEHIPYIGDP
ncbi:disease resistance protein RPM1-like [Miscanthus floridulus]|uniref:disease resistance protein RPM1-like n=1 Tax=Miscanthus floridulus TaxID=154761 RepID=UPI00345828B5